MKIVFRVDASLSLGTGHVMRCLTLANIFRERRMAVSFVCRLHEGHLCDLIEARGFAVRRLAVRGHSGTARATSKTAWLGASWQDDAQQTRAAIEEHDGTVDLLAVDHYSLDARWEGVLRGAARRVFVVDDLADRPHDCDVLLDQNLHDSPESRYLGLVKETTRVFVGPRYAVLRPEFDNFAVRVRDGGVQRLLVYFGGGADVTNELLKIVSALRTLAVDAPVATFVLGPSNPPAPALCRAAAGFDRIRIIEATSEMAGLIDEADLGIGTCGGTAWERCALGLPALVVVTGRNQHDDARILHALGAVRNLGAAHLTGVQDWSDAIRELQNNSTILRSMSLASAAVMRGRRSAMQELQAALVG
jgi:UDP-2,4-diacetamido-2,4,6-trideoxy-beta-L-altropyranose hydrolase